MRRNAAAAIRLADRNVQRKALPVMIELLEKEKDGQVRLAVLDSVIALGHDAVSAVPVAPAYVAYQLRGPATGREPPGLPFRPGAGRHRQTVRRGLARLAERAKGECAAEVVMSLGRIGPDAGAAVPDLIPLLADKTERIRQEASLALGRIGTAAVEPLIAAAANQDVIVRAGAIDEPGICIGAERAGPASSTPVCKGCGPGGPGGRREIAGTIRLARRGLAAGPQGESPSRRRTGPAGRGQPARCSSDGCSRDWGRNWRLC